VGYYLKYLLSVNVLMALYMRHFLFACVFIEYFCDIFFLNSSVLECASEAPRPEASKKPLKGANFSWAADCAYCGNYFLLNVNRIREPN